MFNMTKFRRFLTAFKIRKLTDKQNNLYKLYSELPKDNPQRGKLESEMQILSDKINSLKKTGVSNRTKTIRIEKKPKNRKFHLSIVQIVKKVTSSRKFKMNKIIGSICFVIGVFLFVYYLFNFKYTGGYPGERPALFDVSLLDRDFGTSEKSASPVDLDTRFRYTISDTEVTDGEYLPKYATIYNTVCVN